MHRALDNKKRHAFLLAANICNIIQGRITAVRYINWRLQIQDFQITLQGSIRMLIIIFKPSLQIKIVGFLVI